MAKVSIANSILDFYTYNTQKKKTTTLYCSYNIYTQLATVIKNQYFLRINIYILYDCTSEMEMKFDLPCLIIDNSMK